MKIGDIKKTTVIGAGTMGAQIAEVLSRMGGYEVGMVDINDDLVRKGFQLIDQRLERFFVSKGKITAEEKKNDCESNQRLTQASKRPQRVRTWSSRRSLKKWL